MKNRIPAAILLASAGLTVLAVSACDDPFAQCEKGKGCPPFDDTGGSMSGGSSPGGDGSGGSATSGGTASGGTGGGESGGTSNVGGAPSGGQGGEPSGGAPPMPCDGECPEETPVCDEGEEGTDDDECVGCLKHTDCDDPTRPMCSLDRECVPCLDDFTCTNTLVLADRPVCLDGTEDAETGEERPDTGACAECGRSSDCGGAICDLDTLTCIENTVYKGKGLCDACTDDRECKDGQLCVEMTFPNPVEGVVGSFCQWRKDAIGLDAPKGTCGINSQPYATTMLAAESKNGVVADVCTLRTTTCPALKQHAQTVADCEMEGDDEACGAEGFNDGKCRLDGNSDPKCTYTCVGPEDCPGVSCFDTGSTKYCAL